MASSGTGVHVLLLPYPTQGHINPMLQFARRLAHAGARATLAVSRFIRRTYAHDTGPVGVVDISDGFDNGGFAEAGDAVLYLSRFKVAGSETLAEVFNAQAESGRPVSVLVYDAFVPWALDVAKRFPGVTTAAFFTQACAVNVIYGHVWAGRLKLPVEVGPVRLPGLPPLELDALPSFTVAGAAYPAYGELVLNQFRGLESADHVLVNSFYELEPQEAEYMSSEWRAVMIGPTVPSAYLDKRIPDDRFYGFNLFDETEAAKCTEWLDARPVRSVVYVSFGSMANLSVVAMHELAHGLVNSKKPFLWVVRSSEAPKLPDWFPGEADALIVGWSPQMDVLAHRAVGCFLTHSGWNSTVEAISVGVPMVAMPQWTDQPTDAKYVEDVWSVGVRARPDGEGVVRRGEVERCLREVLDGGGAGEFRRNAAALSAKARMAAGEGGSSDKNIVGFLKTCGM